MSPAPQAPAAPGVIRRKHKLVEVIEPEVAGLVAHPRVASLPEMLLRHGVLQTTLFLRAKGGQDLSLVTLLTKCVKKTTDHDLEATGLARLGPETYMMVNEAAIEAAAWIALLVNARKAGNATAGPAPDADAAPLTQDAAPPAPPTPPEPT